MSVPEGGGQREDARVKRALITGITGQDGSYLAELLLKKGYEVHGLIRRSSTFNTDRIDHIFQDPHDEDARLFLHYGDMVSSADLRQLLSHVGPDEIYNLAAQSHVRVSFDTPEYTGDVVALGTIRLLEAARAAAPGAKFFQASSSEMFGSTPPPQNESSPLHPRSPYAVAKLYAHWATISYREAYGMHNCTGILFNHESPRRGETFVTRKIAMAIPRLLKQEQAHLYLGNLEARRDWAHARDAVDAICRIMDHSMADDFVIGTGEDHSVEEFLTEAFGLVGLKWEGYVRIDEHYYRPAEVEVLRADSAKARQTLNWAPTVSFPELVREMVAAELGAHGLSLETGSSLAKSERRGT